MNPWVHIQLFYRFIVQLKVWSALLATPPHPLMGFDKMTEIITMTRMITFVIIVQNELSYSQKWNIICRSLTGPHTFFSLDSLEYH